VKAEVKNSKKAWGISYGQLVAREFFKNKLNVAGLCFIFVLFTMAVFAPLLANDKPFAIKVDGAWKFPLLGALDAVDYTVFLAAGVVIAMAVLIRRNQRTIAPMERSSVLWNQFGAAFILLVVGTGVMFYMLPEKLDATDYKAMIAEGRAEKAVFAPVPYSFARTDLAAREEGPSRTHWLGTDDVGADVLARLIHGSRISLSVGFVAVGISCVIGIMVGAVLGYFGGKVDFIGMRFVEIMMAVPVFFLILTIISFWPRSLLNIMIIIGLTTWTGDARFIRAEFLKLRKQDFVQAAVSLGLPLRSILFKHILPNGIAPVLVNASFDIAGAIFIEASLSFLGFGVAPPTPSWGQMLSLGVGTTGRFLWWLTLFPGMAIFMTVMAYNLVGEGLRDAIDPRLRKAA